MDDLPDSDDASGSHPLSSGDGSEMAAQDSRRTLPDSLPDGDCASDVDMYQCKYQTVSEARGSIASISECGACPQQADDLPDAESDMICPADDLPDSELGSDYWKSDSEPEPSDIEMSVCDSEASTAATHDLAERAAMHDFAEYFSRPRVVPHVRALGGRAQRSFDKLSSGACKKDFSEECDRASGLQFLERPGAKSVGFSPPCTMFSQLTHLWNAKNMPRASFNEKMELACVLFDFAVHPHPAYKKT